MLINDASITGSLIVNASASLQNISLGGNIIPDETNLRNLGSTDKYFKEIYVSTGSINFVDGGSVVAVLSAGTITAIQSNTSSANSRLTAIESVSASLQSFTASISTTNTFTSSATARLNALETSSASVDTLNTTQSNRLGSLETISASNISRITALETTSASVDTLNTTQNNRLSALETTSASVDTLNTTQNTRLTNLEIKTGSLATTGSNTFIGTQTITGSLYISSDLVVQGSSSLQNITASAVSIGTNLINLNTANPAIRYAGLSIGDSGSIGSSGSFLYDSVQDEMIFIHRGANATVTSSVVLMGPQTYDNIGSETYPTSNIIQKGTGNEHLVDSCIFDNGTTVCINSTLKASGQVCGIMGTFSCIGIGTSSPTTAFEVSSTDLNNIFVTNPTTTGTTTGSGIGFKAYNGTSVAQAGGIILTSNTWSYGTYSANQLSVGSDGTGGIALRTACSAPITFFTGCTTAGLSAERMRISSGGNVGIGTCTPVGKLDVALLNTRRFIVTYDDSIVTIKGASDTGAGENLRVIGDNLIFNTNSVGSGTERMRITSTGIACFACQVCVGGNVLVGNDINAYLEIANGGSTDGKSGIRWMVGSGRTSYGAIELAASSASNGYLSFSTMNSGTVAERMRITSAGISCFSNTLCAPIVVRCATKWQLNGSVQGGNNACALVINVDNARAIRVRGIVTDVSGQTMTSLGMYEAIVYRLGGGAGSESKRCAVLVDSNASPGNSQGIKIDVIGDTLYIQNKSSMSYAQSIVAWAEIFYA